MLCQRFLLTSPYESLATTKGALKLIDAGVFKVKTKHIDVKYHHVHDEQRVHRTVDFHYVSTGKNTADHLTKPLVK